MSCAIKLSVKNLKTYFFVQKGLVKAVNGVSFDVYHGKVLGIVGESGCGKSVTALSILRLIDPPGRIVGGKVALDGVDILSLPFEELRKVRGKEISMIFQDPVVALNPILPVGLQVVETILSHEDATEKEARERALEALSRAGLSQPERVFRQFPFQLSGGMAQRVMIAIAFCLSPKIIIADEPTTSLDVLVQAQILKELQHLKDEFGCGIILITHDFGIVAEVADEVAVMYAGSIVERAEVRTIFKNPLHPYTKALLLAIPRLEDGGKPLKSIEGYPPSLFNLPDNICPFYPRCDWAQHECLESKPDLIEVSPGHFAACFNFERVSEDAFA
jgi:oligopeptide/dipeptide ABC transporter ATP-binding protein